MYTNKNSRVVLVSLVFQLLVASVMSCRRGFKGVNDQMTDNVYSFKSYQSKLIQIYI